MRRSHRRHYRRLGDADMTDSGPLKLTPGKRFSLEAEEPAAPEIKSDFGPSEPPPQKLPSKSKGPKEQILPFMTPKIGNTMVGVGVLSIIGGIGYYIWKGGDIANLWDMIKPSFGGGGGGIKSTFQRGTPPSFTPPAAVVPTRRSTVPGYPAMSPDRY